MQTPGSRFSSQFAIFRTSRKTVAGLGAPSALLVAVLLLAWGVQARVSPDVQRVEPPSSGQLVPSGADATRTFPRDIIDDSGQHVTLSHQPRRIVSRIWSLDEYCYLIAPPKRVVAVTETAYEPSASNVLDQVHRFHPKLANNAEDIVRLEPDLVLVSTATAAEMPTLLHSAGIPVVRIETDPRTLDGIKGTIRLVGRVLGEEETARRVETHFADELARARAMRPVGSPSPRVLGIGGAYSYGDDTLFDNILRSLGATNVGAEGGLHRYASVNNEQILRWNPEWIFAGAASGHEADVERRLLNDPAIQITEAAKRKQVVPVDYKIFMPISPLTSRFVLTIAQRVYGQAR